MFGQFKAGATKMRKSLLDEVARFKNKDFLKAVISGCALTAAADGNISPEEKQKMTRYLENSPELKVFAIKEVITEFNDICAQFDFDAELGRAEALKNIAKVKAKQDQARILVRVCVAIAKSDDDFDQSEKDVIDVIAAELGLNGKEFY